MSIPFGKICMAQMEVVPGSVRANTERMIEDILKARARGHEMIVFPELATCGYIIGDRFEYDDFIREIEAGDEKIRAASLGITVVWGTVVADWARRGEDGRVRKFNAVRIAYDGEYVSNGAASWIAKTNLPKYRMFDEIRHFATAVALGYDQYRTFKVVLSGDEYNIALTICEDLWEDDYSIKPSNYYQGKCDLVVSISASPWGRGKSGARDRMLAKRVNDYNAPIVYVNSCGLQNNVKNLVWFDGGSCVAVRGVDEKPVVVHNAPVHFGGLYSASSKEFGESAHDADYDIRDVYSAVVGSMTAFLGRHKKVVIGLSGGIDSAVSAALLVRALGPEKVLAINMPTKYNSNTTQDLARKCAENLGIEYRVVPIQEAFDVAVQKLASAGYSNPQMLTLENIQARIRGDTLCSIAQEENGVVINNGNKTEVSLNYFTLYGDSVGAACFLADLWKGDVYALARFINQGMEVITQGIIDIVPSAELSADQNVDQGKGDPIFYAYHDKLLAMFAEHRWTPTEVLKCVVGMSDYAALGLALNCEPGVVAKYFDESPVGRAYFVQNLEWCWDRYNIEFKRAQTPPILICSRRAYGFDRRDTIAPASYSTEYEALKQEFLK